jgi:hypothetical protein
MEDLVCYRRSCQTTPAGKRASDSRVYGQLQKLASGHLLGGIKKKEEDEGYQSVNSRAKRASASAPSDKPKSRKAIS